MPRLSRILVLLAGWLPLATLQAQQNLESALPNLATLKPYRTMRASSSDPDWRNGNADARPIPAGQTLTLAELKGPGQVAHIWFTIADKERGYSRLLVLRMYWDGEKNPSVECPVGDFFGIGHGMDVPFDSLPVRVSSDGRGRNCYWPMPFKKSARITITNEGRQKCGAFYYYIDWRKFASLPHDTAYFHAMYRQEFPTVMGRNYLLADIAGRGHYVGTVLSCRQLTRSWWGEGDDFFFIDGEKEPSLRGTGTEDYFCDGWGFRQQAGAFYGAPLMEGNDAGQRTTVYRWHIPDPVAFTKSLRVEIEHKGVTFKPDGKMKSGFEERADDFSSVAFWYQTEPHKPFEPIPAGYRRLYYDYSRIIEGESLLDAAKASEGAVGRQAIGMASGGAQLWWRPSKPNQQLTVTVDVREAGNYELLLLMTHSWDYGSYQAELDGKPIGRIIDLYNLGTEVRDHVFASQALEAGKHTLTFKNRNKNAASKGYFLGLDGLLLEKR